MAISNEQLPGRSRTTLADEALRQDLDSKQRAIATLQTQIKALQNPQFPAFEPPLGSPLGPDEFLTSTPAPGNQRSWQKVPGISPGGLTLIFGEIPSGAVDGTNRVFTLIGTPAATVGVYVGPTAFTLSRVDATIYSVAANVITFTLTNAPPLNSFIRVDYFS